MNKFSWSSSPGVTQRMIEAQYEEGPRTVRKASGIWQPLKDFVREERAAAYVNYLNGGSGVLFGEK